LLGKPVTEAGAPFDAVKAADAFRGYFTRAGLLDGLVKTATTAGAQTNRTVWPHRNGPDS